jgi:hypothetical protein
MTPPGEIKERAGRKKKKAENRVAIKGLEVNPCGFLVSMTAQIFISQEEKIVPDRPFERKRDPTRERKNPEISRFVG